MILYIKLTTLITLMFVSLASVAVPASRQQLEDLISISRTEPVVKSIEGNVVNGVVNLKKDYKHASELIDFMASIISDSFHHTLLLDEVTYHLKKSLSSEDAQTLINWYQSDLGARLLEADAASSTPEASSKIASMRQQLLANTQYVAIARDIDDVLDLSNSLLDLQISMQKTFIKTGLALIAPGKPLPDFDNINESKIDEEARAKMSLMHQQIEESVLSNLVYAYQSFSLAELEQFKTFISQEGVNNYHRQFMLGLSKATEIATHNFLTVLFDAFKNPTPELQKILQNISDATASNQGGETKPLNSMNTSSEQRSDLESPW